MFGLGGKVLFDSVGELVGISEGVAVVSGAFCEGIFVGEGVSSIVSGTFVEGTFVGEDVSNTEIVGAFETTVGEFVGDKVSGEGMFLSVKPRIVKSVDKSAF